MDLRTDNFIWKTICKWYLRNRKSRDADGTILSEAQTTESVLNDGNVETERAGEDAGRGSSLKSDCNAFPLENASEVSLEDKFNVTYIQTKTMVGAIDKSFLYDNIGKNTSRIQKVEYVIKQSRKIMQNPRSNSERKQRHFISESAVNDINYILQEDIKTIEVIRHKYYSGTWGTSIIFNDGKQYSEYNSGSGEFVIASMVDKIQSVPSGGLLLLDEPEVSLHPGAQKRLICYILEMIKKKKIQVIITTHSTSIVENLPKEAIKCFRRIENDIIVIEENVIYKENDGTIRTSTCEI